MSEKISKQRLKALERAEAKLQALEAGGVDNWEWYGESLKEGRRENKLEERTHSLIIDLEAAFGECAYEPSERGAGIAFTDSVIDDVLEVISNHKVTFLDLNED